MREMEEGDWLRRSPRDSRRGMAAHMALSRGQDGPLLKPPRDRWQQLAERMIPLSIKMEGYDSKHLILAVIFRRERRSCAKGTVGVCSEKALSCSTIVKFQQHRSKLCAELSFFSMHFICTAGRNLSRGPAARAPCFPGANKAFLQYFHRKLSSQTDQRQTASAKINIQIPKAVFREGRYPDAEQPLRCWASLFSPRSKGGAPDEYV